LIRNSVNNVYGLVENLLQWSRIQLGYIEFTPVIFDFHKTLLDAMNLLESGLHKKHLSVINLVKKETLVYGDEKMILSVIQNFLSNAIKFSFSGGTIRLESEQLNAYTSISITDGGVGIPSEVIPKLFDIDSQYSTRGTNNESGTGLGLILCRELIEKNRGQINVKSELGKGSTFIFTIPTHKTVNVN
jgi:signal transduction histidine kinase